MALVQSAHFPRGVEQRGTDMILRHPRILVEDVFNGPAIRDHVQDTAHGEARFLDIGFPATKRGIACHHADQGMVTVLVLGLVQGLLVKDVHRSLRGSISHGRGMESMVAFDGGGVCFGK